MAVQKHEAGQRIAVVTDSAAAIHPELVEHLSVRGNFMLVPMPVTIRVPEGEDRSLQGLSPSDVDEAIMLAHVIGQTVSTSGPAPGVFADVYDELASRGYTHVVSAHLSSELSGTVEAARTGARLSSLGAAGVSVVDSRTVAGAYGHAVVRALDLLNGATEAGELSSPLLVEFIEELCARAALYFYIPTLDALRRGGRVSPALAMVGQMFQIKPIGTVEHGKLTYVERPRTAARALDRLVELTVQACREHRHAGALGSADVFASTGSPDSAADTLSVLGAELPGLEPRGEVVAVHHVGNAGQAVQLYHRVRRMLGEGSLSHGVDNFVSSAFAGEENFSENVPDFLVSSLPPVLSAHSGLGAVAMVVY